MRKRQKRVLVRSSLYWAASPQEQGNPKQMDRFRDRHAVAGAKHDALDAFVMADSLRTDRPRFRGIQIDEPAILRLGSGRGWIRIYARKQPASPT
jgi:hypothetical protein